MPVEIKELVIRAVISADAKKDTTAVESNSGDSAIVQACVHQVLKILKKQKRR